MHRTRIKICGVTRPEDGRIAAECGADAVGLVMFPGARRAVTRERACEIVDALPPFVTPVALFVNASPREVLDTVSDLRIRHVQLHGDETAEDVAALSALLIIKAIRVRRDGFSLELDQWRAQIAMRQLNNLAGIVLETAAPSHIGGSGVQNDWATIARHRESGNFENLPPIIAAGGLNAENVGGVIRAVRPWSVDVSSGVEEHHGQKSAARLEAFCDAVRAADATS